MKHGDQNYISLRESRRITRANLRATRALEKARNRKNVPESEFQTVMRDENNVVEFDDLRTYFYTDAGVVRAVDGVSFDVPKGKTVGVVGESGCGKSVTSLSLMQLLQRPQGQITGGAIRLNMGDGALDIAKMPEAYMGRVRGKAVSMIFQEPMTSLNPVLRVGEQVDEVIALHHPGMRREDVRARSVAALEDVGIANAKGVCAMFPHELSGGMRQRVMIAIALSTSPRLIVADEPTTALDVTIQAQILDLLRSVKSRAAILLITHDLGVVAQTADFVVVMYAGRVVEKGETLEVFQNPAHPYTAGLMAATPVIGRDTGRLRAIPGAVPNPVDMPDSCYFRERCDGRCPACDGPYPPMVRLSQTHTAACYACKGDKP